MRVEKNRARVAFQCRAGESIVASQCPARNHGNQNESQGSLLSAEKELKESIGNTTRRSLLRNAALVGAAAVAAPTIAIASEAGAEKASASSFVNVLEQPALVTVFLQDKSIFTLTRSGNSWREGALTFDSERTQRGLRLRLAAPGSSVLRVHFRWCAKLQAATLRILGDAWERSYGELGWREVVPERALPWYFLTFDGHQTHGYGVAVGAAAFAFWLCDGEGVSLWLDVRNGGNGVLLGERSLPMVTVIAREGESGEAPMTAARALCHLMSPSPKKSSGPIYGSNDWYYAYGKNTPAGILRDADLVAELAPAGGTRPFSIIDMGWEDQTKFPDMTALAATIRSKGVRPGIWIRPTQPVVKADPRLLLPANRFASAQDAEGNPSYDPTIPDGLDAALARVRQVKAYQFELIKHDFSTFDLLGQWGFTMSASPARGGWNFSDRSHTSAEIIRSFYEAINHVAGDSLVIGCNTIGHIGAGLFDAQRIGDDVSGKMWERSRRMGVNTLAFRLAQHNAFFAADADCVPLTSAIPWRFTRQWLDLVAKSGTVLLISPEPGAVNAETKAVLKSAFAIAAKGGQELTPVDWFDTHTPGRWQAGAASGGAVEQYDWLGEQGAYPFEV
jgi:alpha-galactosidase